MSISSEINRISQNITNSLSAIAAKGVTVPAGSTSDDLPDLITQISGGGNGGIIITDTTDSHGGTIRTITGTTISGTKTITQNGTGIDVASYANVDVNVPTGGATLQSKTNISPTESSQTITPDTGYDGLSSVQINAVPSNYVGTGVPQRGFSAVTLSGDTISVLDGYYPLPLSKMIDTSMIPYPTATKSTVSNNSVYVTPHISLNSGYYLSGTENGIAVKVSASELVSGSQTITSNGIVDVTNLASVNVSVPVGVTTFVTGTFTTGSSAGASDLSISYSGSGYPILLTIVIEGGAYASGSSWYSKIQRYAIAEFTMTKADFTLAPTYDNTSASSNYGVITYIYKSSSTSATTYTRGGSMNATVFTTSAATNSASQCVRIKDKNTVSYYVNSSSYGLAPSTTYRYFVQYSA